MIDNINDISFSENYFEWLKSNIHEIKISDTVSRISTPFLDRNNDFTEVYIINEGKGIYTITDDSSTINELNLSGYDVFSTEKRKSYFERILNSHGVTLKNGSELTITGSLSELPLKKHMLIQCMIKISDLFVLSQNNIKSIFLEDVKIYLETNNIDYFEDISLIGKSHLYSNFDFAISKTKLQPQRMIKVVNKLDTNYAKSIIFSWKDIEEVRKSETRLYTFISDTQNKYSSDAINALQAYDIVPVLWKDRNKYTKELAS